MPHFFGSSRPISARLLVLGTTASAVRKSVTSSHTKTEKVKGRRGLAYGWLARNNLLHDWKVSSQVATTEEARRGLRVVTEGEDKTVEGWLIYGAALNEGRKRFPKGDNTRFNEWMRSHQLDGCNDMNRLAAMSPAGNPEQLQETRKAHPRVRTVRGLLAGH